MRMNHTKRRMMASWPCWGCFPNILHLYTQVLRFCVHALFTSVFNALIQSFEKRVNFFFFFFFQYYARQSEVFQSFGRIWYYLFIMISRRNLDIFFWISSWIWRFKVFINSKSRKDFFLFTLCSWIQSFQFFFFF